MLSRSCIYGLQAVLYLAAQEQGGYVPIRQISDNLGLSHPFLTKVLQQLTRQGLMQSLRGPNGGVTLSQPPDTISLADIVEAIDGSTRLEACILGLPDCSVDNPCVFHERWQPVRCEILSIFSETTLLELARLARTRSPRTTKSPGLHPI